MRKSVIMIFIVALAFLTCQNLEKPRATAEIKYAMVISDNSAFYSDASCTMIKFYLPYSYFVKIISIGTDYSRVVYMDSSHTYPSREGYVKNVDLDFSFTNPENPYPAVTLTAISDEVLFADTAKTMPKTVITQNSPVTYYGNITVDGEKYLYVYSQGFIGYVRKSGFSELNLTVHPLASTLNQNSSSLTSQDDLEKDKQVEPKQSTSFSFENYKAFIIIGVILAVCGLLYFILRPDRLKKSEQSFFKDSDDF